MHPPWINFLFFLFLFSAAHKVSGKAEVEKESKENENSTAVRSQREVYERERRLIPYMTYYITQNLNPNSGTRQNIFLPITATREGIFQVDGVTKTSVPNIQNLNPQQYEIVPKTVVRVQSPSFLTSAIQTTQQNIPFKPKPEGNIFPQFYRLPGFIRPRIPHPNQPQQIQSETHPLQIIKLNQVPTEQKYNQPEIIKIVPVIAKLPIENNKSPKSFPSPQSQYAYPDIKIQRLVPQSYSGDQNYYKESATPLRENKIYSGHIPHQPQVAIIGPTVRPEKNKYTVSQIILGSTTLSPYTKVKFNSNVPGTKILDSDVTGFNSARINLTPGGYEGEIMSTVPSYTSEKYVPITATEQQEYPNQDSEEGVQSQKAEQVPRLRVPQEEKLRFVTSVTPAPVSNDLENSQHVIKYEEEKAKPLVYDKSLDNILSILKETNKLPQNLTPDNIDTGIKTLALILERLQEYKNYQQKIPIKDSPSSDPATVIIKSNHQHPNKVHSFPERSGTSTPGRPGIDYPVYSSIPQTKFDCSTQRYKGFFGDPDTNCQVWHYCDLNGGQASFLCPNGTIFSQVALTCDWWFNVKCESTSQLYVLNERLYKYILPFSPSFPEDYSGPIVDTYLAAKFKEMEAKSKSKALKSATNSTSTEKPEISTEAIKDEVTESIEYRTINPQE